ncbi:MAG: Mrp/NBP35 family ATP-binding protein [Candidatus Cloacimonadaceae bacterium]|nr:Mrp/NBP35 family ATP-binding protein [Candidatus Cloacimonadaceae bacterium]
MDENAQKEKNLRENLARIKHRILVMSGKGGVGKSFIAVNLAYGLAMQGKKVGLLDVDIHGPSLAKLMNIEGMPIPMNKQGDMPTPIKVLSNLSVLTVATLLADADAALIWRGPLKMALIKQFFTDFEWEELDYLVVDCPPGTGDEPLSIIQTLEKVDGTVMVTTPQDLALIDVIKSVSFSEKMNVPILGIIENMKYFVCPHCGEQTRIFNGNKIEELIFSKGIELLAELEIDPNVGITSDKGRPYIYDCNKLPNAEKLMLAVDKIIAKIDNRSNI